MVIYRFVMQLKLLENEHSHFLCKKSEEKKRYHYCIKLYNSQRVVKNFRVVKGKKAWRSTVTFTIWIPTDCRQPCYRFNDVNNNEDNVVTVSSLFYFQSFRHARVSLKWCFQSRNRDCWMEKKKLDKLWPMWPIFFSLLWPYFTVAVVVGRSDRNKVDKRKKKKESTGCVSQ